MSRRLNQTAFESARPAIPWHVAGVYLTPPALRELPQPGAYWESFHAPVRQTPHRPRHRRRGDIRRSEVSNSSTERRDSWRGKPLISFDLGIRFRSYPDHHQAARLKFKFYLCFHGPGLGDGAGGVGLV